MATLVLTAVGSAIGGTMGAVGLAVGGAIGAMAGRSVDALIFRPGARSGPRLTDLQVQTSRYGAPIPRLHGKIRVAGTVIWATDLKESSATQGGGKGQPSVTTFSYSSSLAVALSSRPIRRIGRIWADGNLLRGAGGDFKSPVGAFRVHLGGADQELDPLIAAAVGGPLAPAYRGCAYVVFEGLQLTDFGNRIPSLTFEVIADTGMVALHSIAADGSGVPVSGDSGGAMLTGFAAEGTLHEAMRDLISLHDVQWQEAEGTVSLITGRASDHELRPNDAVSAVDGRSQGGAQHRRTPIEAVPARLAVRYHDQERDYQVGVQASSRPGPGLMSDEVDLPAVIAASDARSLADRKLRNALQRRRTIETTMDWSALTVRQGDIVTILGESGRWLVEASEWSDMVVRFSLRAFEGGTRQLASTGEAGEVVRQPDLVQGATSLAIIELPGDGTSAATAPIIAVAATGASAGWRRAALFRYNAEMETAELIGRTAPRAVLGAAIGALAPVDPWRIDLVSEIEVVLDHVGDTLTGVAHDLLIGGANLCQIGEELLQFGRAERVSSGRYRLSHLVRGRHGTEWATAGHAAAERFALIDAERLMLLTTGPEDVGTMLTVRAIGSGDVVPAQTQRSIDGRAMMPLSPVHGRAMRRADGDIELSWIRRSRLGGAWIDGADVPLGEEQELYALSVMAGTRELRRWDVGSGAALYQEADFIEDVSTAGSDELRIEIRQRGSWGLSRPLVVALP